jgi:hypothetical protein
MSRHQTWGRLSAWQEKVYGRLKACPTRYFLKQSSNYRSNLARKPSKKTQMNFAESHGDLFMAT